MWDDCTIPEFVNVTEPVARKEYVCCECGGSIAPKTKYVRISGKWDGDIETYKQHLECANACRAIRDERNDCIPFGLLFEDISDNGLDSYAKGTRSALAKMFLVNSKCRQIYKKGFIIKRSI